MFRKPVPEYSSIALDTPQTLSETPSNEVKSHGPVIESKWGIGWKTISSMLFFFVLALLIAIAHLIIFLKLDGKLTDGDGILPQTYVAATSTLLVNAFGTSLIVSLGFAFTQWLWHVFRTKSMSVETVETLYGIRWSPLLLLDWAAWQAAPLVCFMALTMLLLAIARIFPPGALTIVSRDLVNATDLAVPTFTSDGYGNGSNADAENRALGGYAISTSLWKYTALHPALRRVAYSTLTTGRVLSAPSPCGANCSYELSFEGPYFTCTNFTEIGLARLPDYRTNVGNPVWRYFSAGWSPDRLVPWLEGEDPAGDDPGTPTFPSFYMNLSSPIGYYDASVNSTGSLVSETYHLKCQPAAVTYDLNVTFENGVRSLSYSTRDDIRPLSEIYVAYTIRPGRYDDPTYMVQNWTTNHTANYRTTNLYALMDSVADALAGSYPMYSDYDARDPLRNVTLTNGTELEIIPSGPAGFDRTYQQRLGPNKTVVAVTSFNKNYDSLNLSAPIELHVSEDILNAALANVTLSTINSIPYWDTTANVTRWTARNFYSFSNPKNLFAPYGVSLLVAFPFLIIGIIALNKNGVSAIDGSFLQILMTTTGSKRLHEAAAGGCLGGEENVPKHLKDQKIRFGELVTGDAPMFNTEQVPVRRAGFGFEDEIAPLRKRGRYGADSE